MENTFSTQLARQVAVMDTVTDLVIDHFCYAFAPKFHSCTNVSVTVTSLVLRYL